LSWLLNFDHLCFTYLYQHLYMSLLINNLELVCINNCFFLSFNSRVLFLHRNLFWSNRDYLLIIIDAWWLIIVQWLIPMFVSLVYSYLFWILIHVVRHVLVVLHVLEFLSFYLFFDKFFHVFLVFCKFGSF